MSVSQVDDHIEVSIDVTESSTSHMIPEAVQNNFDVVEVAENTLNCSHEEHFTEQRVPCDDQTETNAETMHSHSENSGLSNPNAVHNQRSSDDNVVDNTKESCHCSKGTSTELDSVVGPDSCSSVQSLEDGKKNTSKGSRGTSTEPDSVVGPDSCSSVQSLEDGKKNTSKFSRGPRRRSLRLQLTKLQRRRRQCSLTNQLQRRKPEVEELLEVEAAITALSDRIKEEHRKTGVYQSSSSDEDVEFEDCSPYTMPSRECKKTFLSITNRNTASGATGGRRYAQLTGSSTAWIRAASRTSVKREFAAMMEETIKEGPAVEPVPHKMGFIKQQALDVGDPNACDDSSDDDLLSHKGPGIVNTRRSFLDKTMTLHAEMRRLSADAGFPLDELHYPGVPRPLSLVFGTLTMTGWSRWRKRIRRRGAQCKLPLVDFSEDMKIQDHEKLDKEFGLFGRSVPLYTCVPDGRIIEKSALPQVWMNKLQVGHISSSSTFQATLWTGDLSFPMFNLFRKNDFEAFNSIFDPLPTFLEHGLFSVVDPESLKFLVYGSHFTPYSVLQTAVSCLGFGLPPHWRVALAFRKQTDPNHLHFYNYYGSNSLYRRILQPGARPWNMKAVCEELVLLVVPPSARDHLNSKLCTGAGVVMSMDELNSHGSVDRIMLLDMLQIRRCETTFHCPPTVTCTLTPSLDQQNDLNAFSAELSAALKEDYDIEA